ncbi:hypothetical protein U1Q18_021143 [Sarracenia purpurea var. burkii]
MGHAGEIRLILHYANAKKPATSYAPSAPPYVAPSAPQVPMYSTPPPASSGPYPPPATAYPAPSPYASYPPNSVIYSAPPYHPLPPSAYPPPYQPPSAYPPPPYPPPPPPPQAPPYYPPGYSYIPPQTFIYLPCHSLLIHNFDFQSGPFPGIYPPPPPY